MDDSFYSFSENPDDGYDDEWYNEDGCPNLVDGESYD